MEEGWRRAGTVNPSTIMLLPEDFSGNEDISVMGLEIELENDSSDRYWLWFRNCIGSAIASKEVVVF